MRLIYEKALLENMVSKITIINTTPIEEKKNEKQDCATLENRERVKYAEEHLSKRIGTST